MYVAAANVAQELHARLHDVNPNIGAPLLARAKAHREALKGLYKLEGACNGPFFRCIAFMLFEFCIFHQDKSFRTFFLAP